MDKNNDLYLYYKDTIQNEQFPLLILDVEKFETNINQIKQRLKGKKSIRVASKSIRSIPILKMIFEIDPAFHGILSYSGEEAIFLSQQGFKDIVVAYPVVNRQELSKISYSIKNGADITLMIDSIDHVERIREIAKEKDVTIPVCIDLDMSTKFFALHFGVFRSPITNKTKALSVAECVKKSSNVRLRGVMGYEAQIAGLPDRSPSKNFLLNFIIRRLKKKSIKTIRKQRHEIVIALREAGFLLEFVNGGGTGSIEFSSAEDVVTEVTVGSGLYSSHLFDYYDSFRHTPALFYALEITRIPKSGIYTCHGGGYVASGSLGIDKIPKPYLPRGSKLLENEMAGEVQTPIRYKGKLNLGIGDPVFMRHSKAGELCEHFNEIIIIKDGKIIEIVKTYRGEGKVFL